MTREPGNRRGESPGFPGTRYRETPGIPTRGAAIPDRLDTRGRPVLKSGARRVRRAHGEGGFDSYEGLLAMKQGRTTLAYDWCCAVLLGLCALSMTDVSAADSPDHPVVVLDTTAGPVTLELDRTKAPITVDNFVKYVDAGYFDGLVFHRVIPGFMIQGGGFTDQLAKKSEGMRPPIQNEARNGLSNLRGTIAMARTSNPNSASSQFFINLVDNGSSLDPNSESAGYAVFGKVISGMNAVDAIAKVPTGRKNSPDGPLDNVPLQPVVIKSARRKPGA
jgi:peptidyl-prolyl cis-trans isomerase A (cyclophilin A)